jgi:hypothetical protein
MRIPTQEVWKPKIDGTEELKMFAWDKWNEALWACNFALPESN